MIINPIIDTIGVGGLTSSGFAIYGSGVSLDNWLSDIYADETSVIVTTSSSSSLLSEMMDLEKNGYNTVQAMTYIESCSIEERDDLINQIDQLLNEESKSDVKTLSRRI